jgi:hypothetical protein
MAEKNIDKEYSRRTGRRALRVTEGARRRAPDMSNFTVSQLRELLGRHSPSLLDKDAEEVVTVVRRMAQQATAPGSADPPPDFLDRRSWDVSVVAPSEWIWDIGAVAEAAKTLHSALPTIARWWAGLFPSDATRKGRAAMDDLAEPLDRALYYLRYPLGEYEPLPPNQIGGKLGHKPWHIPAVILANMLDRMLRRPGDARLPPFSHGSRLTIAIHAILTDLGLKPGEVSAVAAYIERWWGKYGRLPLGVTDGRQLLREAAKRALEGYRSN